MLVTGPTGSGKTTTLAAMIDHINHTRVLPHRHHRGPGRVPPQGRPGRHRPARGRLRHRQLRLGHAGVLRQDPDVILVGEMRDPETV